MNPTFPIVGVGASAGGIEALGQFFDVMPADSGMAFVIVLHLDPTRESQLAPILGHHTAMTVKEITDGMPIEPDHVYVIAPDAYLTVNDHRLHLSKPSDPRGHRFPVDALFASLAESQRERAICMVLSGTGHNGTQGLKEVKAQGGCTIVQDPATARFDGMPRSAIAADVADRVLAPARMPDFLQHYVAHDYVAAPLDVGDEAPEPPETLDPLLALLRMRSGHDFRSYKRSTLLRRVHRRMGLANVVHFEDYLEHLRGKPAEVQALTKDLMISVTGFFRDPEAWRALDKLVLTPLVADCEAGSELRFWVPACSTGEEAYSLAMLAIERLEAAKKDVDLKIFATDGQEHNLVRAREGIYPEAALEGLPPERLQRFFDRFDGSYQVKRDLRELVVFAPHNLLRDPPFSRLDLVTCRNLLIYLEPEAQKKVIALFHFALKEGSHLLLGNAETVGRHADLFETKSKKWRIYSRFGPTRHDILSFPLLGTSGRLADPGTSGHAESQQEPHRRAAEIARRTLLARYAPAAVLVDLKGRILYFHGSTGDYLEPPSGEPTGDLLAMAREGLRQQLRLALREVADRRQNTTFTARIRQGETLRHVAVRVSPVSTAQAAGGQILVTFEPVAAARGSDGGARDGESPRGVSETHSQSQADQEEELKALRAELQSTTEQMESANEELKAANEEVTSMNEELQSTNEELETSKEELQSYNEELQTINSQLQHKVQELEDLSNDQRNLMAGSDIATIFLDTQYRIKWYSPSVKDLIDLVPSDIGRPLGHFAPKFADKTLLRDAETVLDRLSPLQVEVRSDAGAWYQRRVLPYRTQDNRIAGVVITFADVTDRKRAADETREARVFADAIVETVRQPLLVLDEALRVQRANAVFYDLFKVAAEGTVARLVYELGNGQWNVPELRHLLEEILPNDEVITDFVVEHAFETIGHRTMVLNARRLERNGDRPGMILLAIEDVTEQRRAEAHQVLLFRELNHRVKNILAMVQSLAGQSMKSSPSLDAFQKSFEGRLHALARAHDLLVEKKWKGIELGDLIRRTLEPYDPDGGRIALDGPQMLLKAQTCTALVLILHELATNAAKYGALTGSTGRLKVAWWLDSAQSKVHLQWEETEGPEVQPLTRRGFGTKLIESSATYELHGRAAVTFRKEGLRCDIEFPWQGPEEAAEPG